MNNLGIRISERIGEATALKRGQAGLDNAEQNRQYFGKTINDLPGSNKSELDGAAIVMVGGPSLHRKDPATKILASGFEGDIIVADGSLGYCLRNGLVPTYVITLDPDLHRIVRWFGDTELETRPEDDYFLRQDFDLKHKQDQIGYNNQLIELVNRYGKEIKVIISTSAPLPVTRRCIESGMELFWWNPLYDDPSEPNSISKKLFESNRIPCMVTGGNVGTAAWIFAHAVLKRKHVALTGMDLGYAPGTPLLNTQYYYEMVELFGEKAVDAYIQIYNPYLGETWFTDPTYYWYRSVFLDLVKDAECITYNCTEGGTLFSKDMTFVKLIEFLDKFTESHVKQNSNLGEGE